MGVVAGQWIPFIPVSMVTLTSPRAHHENELAPERGSTIDKSGISSCYSCSSGGDMPVWGQKEVLWDETCWAGWAEKLDIAYKDKDDVFFSSVGAERL
jgi:hypothetical protein